MSDFRQAAIDAILEDLDFDSVKELRAYVSKNKQDDYFYGGILYAINAVQDLSSAQPEIIRCKECKHAKITADGKYMKYCSQWDVDDALYLDSGFFCGHAERRTDE